MELRARGTGHGAQASPAEADAKAGHRAQASPAEADAKAGHGARGSEQRA